MTVPGTLSSTCYAREGCSRPRQTYSAYCREHNGIPTPLPRPCLKPLRCYCPACSAEWRESGSAPSGAGMGQTDLKTTRRFQAQADTARERAERHAERLPPPPGWRNPTSPLEGVTPPPSVGFGHPGTSHTAAAAMVGLPAGRIRVAVLAAVARAGPDGATDDDIERYTGRSHQTVSSARNALAATGYLTDTGRTRPTRSGRPATLWRVSDAVADVAATLLAQGTPGL